MRKLLCGVLTLFTAACAERAGDRFIAVEAGLEHHLATLSAPATQTGPSLAPSNAVLPMSAPNGLADADEAALRLKITAHYPLTVPAGPGTPVAVSFSPRGTGFALDIASECRGGFIGFGAAGCGNAFGKADHGYGFGGELATTVGGRTYDVHLNRHNKKRKTSVGLFSTNRLSGGGKNNDWIVGGRLTHGGFALDVGKQRTVRVLRRDRTDWNIGVRYFDGPWGLAVQTANDVKVNPTRFEGRMEAVQVKGQYSLAHGVNLAGGVQWHSDPEGFTPAYLGYLGMNVRF